MTVYLQHGGLAISIRGYGAVFNRPSVHLADLDGRREVVASGAFDFVLKLRPLDLTCSAFHLDGGGLASIRMGNLDLWADDFGLAFAAGPLQPTPTNRSVVHSIVTGQLRGCSWRATPAKAHDETLDGEPIRVITKFQSLDHFGPVEEGAYPDAVCWCSHEDSRDLPWRLQEVIAHFNDNRPAARPRGGVIRQTAALAASARSARPAPAAVADWAAPPPGIARDDWLWFGMMEAHARRARQRT